MATKSKSLTQKAIKQLLNDKLAIISFIIIIVYILIALLIQTNILKLPINETVGASYEKPSWSHILGTDIFGRDVFIRILYGIKISISIGLITIAIAVPIGIILGSLAGYFGGRVDSIIMRLVDLIMVFPALILLILFAEMLGDNIWILQILFGLLSIPLYARLMRSSVLQVKNNLYIEAATTGGAKNFKKMVKHIIPNAINPIVINFFGGVGAAILGLTSISFLGFGDPRLPDWGSDINYARNQFSGYFAAFWPGLFILVAVLGFMLVGDSLRDALDPKNK